MKNNKFGVTGPGPAPVTGTLPAKMNYVCNACGRINDIKPKDCVQCIYCGCRILKKIRGKSEVVVMAR